MLPRLLLPAVAALSLATLLPASLDAVSFKTTLSSVKLYGRPGQVLTSVFRLTLDKDQTRTRFRAHINDWWRSEDGRQSFYAAPGTLERSCGKWVSINPVEADVRPGETLTVRLSVAVPKTGAPGGYWCVLTVDEVPDPLASSERIALRFLASVSTGIFVYLDPVTRAAQIMDVRVTPDDVVVRLRNEGNAPVGVEGRFEFVRPGETTPVSIVRLMRGTLLTDPVSVSEFSSALPPPDTLPSGRYLVRAVIDYGVDHFIGAQRELELTRRGEQIAGGSQR
jgi:hypothetical protein